VSADTETPETRFDDYRLDENTLAEVASLMCGDDGPYYRQGWQLPKLLERAGWSAVAEYDRSPRRMWLTDQLHARRTERGAMTKLICRLADSREYFDNPAALTETVRQLNELLAHEGFRVQSVAGRGRIVDAASTNLPEYDAPIELRTTVAALVNDPVQAKALQRRLAEARACQEGGAHLAAVIMMGSLLEGVLVQVLLQRGMGTLAAISQLKLHELITRAHAKGWIEADVEKFSQELRLYRNLVHVDAELRLGHTPDADTARVCWYVVVAALNDLANSAA
jgi:hypothetical protein